MLNFDKKVLFVGYGAVSRCTVPLFMQHVNVDPKNVTVMDFEPKHSMIAEWEAKGVTYVQDKVTQENMGALLGQYVGAGDLLIDLAWNIDCCEIVQWCHDKGVLYINTSVELWDPYCLEGQHPTKSTLYWRHQNLRRMIAGWSTPGPTAVLEHGANPGLISHWTKKGLLDIAAKLVADGLVKGAEAEEIQGLAKDRIFNKLAQKMGVKVIHCSERDTQIANRPKEVGEFVNTWSIEGFREEGTTTAEMGWGTHEKQLPALAFEHEDGPKNQICMARMGINVRVRSWVPDFNIQGMVVRHGEAYTISDYLTVWENGKAAYRPTVHYAYCPCDDAITSLHELRGDDYQLQGRLRIMGDEITSGSDILGALIMGHAFNSWWTGSDLSIERSRELAPHQNATTLQVAISVVAASMWMIENPDRGVQTPDNLPHDYVLGIAEPYLGNNISVPSDWTPLKHQLNHFGTYSKPALDTTDPWQFHNFLVTENGD
jgi:homospermidine synthase